MLSATEWNRFYCHRKSLRVSSPTQTQRSTYWLQLPWTYSFPLVVASGVLHWLVSQSLFPVFINQYDPNGLLESTGGSTSQGSIAACGFSVYALLLTFILGSFMYLILILTMNRKLPGGMPVVGSCSLAISAACHPPREMRMQHINPSSGEL